VAFDGFESYSFDIGGVTVHARVRHNPAAGARPVLLLHGFPQTHFIWHKVANELARQFSVVCADLRGYGDSGKPPGLADHSNYSKRAMAGDLGELMSRLGYPRFSVVGHDRGGRVAHRLALDAPESVTRLAVIDISPTLTMYARTDMQFARAYFHWFFLIQPAPFPERLMAGDARAVLHTFLGRWGNDGLTSFGADALEQYERCWATPEGLHASCEDYRASAGIDLDHDRMSDAEGQLVGCPMLVLWGERGIIGKMFDPLADWTAKCSQQVIGKALPAGHFIPEEVPAEMMAELLPFLTAS